MKKILAMVLALTMCLAMAACAPAQGGNSGEKTDFVVGVCQLMKHDSLDQATQGFVDALKAAVEAEGKTVSVDVQVAGDADLCPTVINTFTSRKTFKSFSNRYQI